MPARDYLQLSKNMNLSDGDDKIRIAIDLTGIFNDWHGDYSLLNEFLYNRGRELLPYLDEMTADYFPMRSKIIKNLKSRDPWIVAWLLRQIFVSDDVAMTVAAIEEILADGADLVAVTGGMSVDPDDQTPAGIRAAGGRVVTYGAPTFPGAMFMLAYIGDVPVVGLPGCVMYFRASIFDLVVPRIVAGERLTRKDITVLGHGGFCSGCNQCRYPVCGFGKGH